MSDYTPTTEEVVLPPLNEEVIKQLALLGLDQMVVDVDDKKAEQFLAHVDRWLAEVKAQAFAQGRDSQRDYAEHVERERIIARLQDEWENPNGNDSWAHCLCITHFHQIIDVIKGETK